MVKEIIPRFSSVDSRCPRAWRHLPVALVGVILVFAATAPLFPQDLVDPDTCYRVALSEHIYWAKSGAWVGDERSEALLVVDTISEDILRISHHGRVELCGGVLSASRTRLPGQPRCRGS